VPLSTWTQELERLAAGIGALEVRLAGSPEPSAEVWLRRLAGASQHLQAARAALAGLQANEPSRTGHLQGSSEAVPIQDLLCFLATTKKSGVLRVEAGDERFLLQLDQGSVVYASGDAPPAGESLSDLLAARGVLSAELLGTLPGRASGEGWSDRNLVGTSWISRESLSSSLQEQTRLAFFRMCSAGHTRFRFYEGAQIENVVPIRQNAVELLLEYSRTLDEGAGRAALCAPAPAAAPPRREPGVLGPLR